MTIAGSREDTGSTEKSSKSEVIKEKWNNFVENSSLPAIQNIASSQTTLRRIIWILFLLSGLGCFSYQFAELLTKYLSFPVTTKFILVYKKELEFPAITICNFNMLRKSVIERFNYGKVADHALMSKSGKQMNDTGIDWSLYEIKNPSDIYHIAGHQKEDMILECYWKGEECSHLNFTYILTSMGLCHTFNSGKDGQDILKVSYAGAKFGLTLRLNIEQYDYYGKMMAIAGLKVLIHDHQTPPMVEQLGFSLAPGTSTLAAIRKEEVVNLEDPYETKCKESQDAMEHISGYSKYTTSACMLSCHSRYLEEKCGCKDSRILSEEGTNQCGVRKLATCIFRESENFYKIVGNHCQCPIPCNITSFKPVLSYANFPSDIFMERLIEKYRENATEDEKEEYKKWAKRNYLELNVYFQDLNTYHLEQQEAYSRESLLGEIGGQLGLYIGASLLTLFELFEIIFTILKIRFGREE